VARWRITRWQTLTLLSLLALVIFTLIVWREQRAGGACYEQRLGASGSASYLCSLISPSNLPTDYLVIVGIGGIFVAISTLKSALLNAHALINSERAWIMVFLQQRPPGPPYLASTGAEGITTHLMVSTKTRNSGRSPAWIVEEHYRFDILNSLDELPTYPGGMEVFKTFTPLSPGESGPEDTFQTLPCAKPFDDSKIMVVYGKVVYRDSFGPDKETYFGYRVHSTGRFERLSRHLEYNKAT
jgi:hypothetical protein